MSGNRHICDRNGKHYKHILPKTGTLTDVLHLNSQTMLVSIDSVSVNQVKISLQEIITGYVPFPEIRSGAVVIRLVIEGRTPLVTELQTSPPSSRATITLGVLYWCWRYNPSERATAKEVRAIVSLLSYSPPG
jgi:hypothetical protein